MIKNVVIGTIEKTRKPYTKKTKLETPSNKIDDSKFSKNESFEFFIGKNLDDGTDPLDFLLAGKKIIYKKKWIILKTNHNKHGKVMNDKRAFESGPSASDNFFNENYYQKSHYIVQSKKTKKIVFDEIDFYLFCDYLNELK